MSDPHVILTIIGQKVTEVRQPGGTMSIAEETRTNTMTECPRCRHGESWGISTEKCPLCNDTKLVTFEEVRGWRRNNLACHPVR